MRICRSIITTLLCVAAGFLVYMGCEDSGGGSSSGNHDFGDNDPQLVVAMGDSITAGFGLPGAASYPAQLAGLTGRPVRNSGVNGDSSASGASRAAGVLSSAKPGYLLILYGSNDIIQGRDLVQAKENLRAIVGAAKANQTIPILGTVPNGIDSHAFMAPGVQMLNGLIGQLAGEEGVAVAGVNGAMGSAPAFFQADGLHPSEAGAGRIAIAFSGRL